MGKSKSQNIQKNKNNNNSNNKPEYVQPEQINFTMYTFVTMLATLVATACATVMMVLNGKPIYYVLEGMVGDSLNEYSYEMAELLLYDIVDEGTVNGLYLGLIGLTIVPAIISIVGLVRAMNQYAKPIIVPYIVGLVFSIATLVLYIYTDNFMHDKLLEVVMLAEPKVGLYNFIIVVVILNIVAMIGAIVAAISGLKRWKETGKTSK